MRSWRRTVALTGIAVFCVVGLAPSSWGQAPSPTEESKTLDGLWQGHSDGSVVKITQHGDSVTAEVVTPNPKSTGKVGDLSFRATLKGRDLDGKILTVIPREYDPGGKDPGTWADLWLKVSPIDGSLEGQYRAPMFYKRTGKPAPGGQWTPIGFRRYKQCGPDVTEALKRTLKEKIYYRYLDWTEDEQRAACAGLTSLALDPERAYQPAFKNAWDIEELHLRPRVTNNFCCSRDCLETVEVDGECFYAGSVNYVAFGLMASLCGAAEEEMIKLINLHKGPDSPYSKIFGPASNWEKSVEWAMQGYRGWPWSAWTPKGDRNECTGRCGVRWTGDFTVYWYGSPKVTPPIPPKRVPLPLPPEVPGGPKH